VEIAYQALSQVSSYTAWKHFQELQAHQWLSREELEAIRWTKMQKLLAYAATEVPFYRNLWGSAGVDPCRFTSIEDLKDLPVVTRSALIKAQEEDAFLLSRRNDYELTHSSGTTGPWVYLPFTRHDMQVKYAGYLREFYATDWRLGVPSAAIHYSGHPEFGGRYTGRPDRDNFLFIRKFVFRLAHRRILLNPYAKSESGDESVVGEWYRALRRHQPFLLETMDFNLVTLYHYIQKRNLPPLRIPRTIVLATLAPGFKRTLEEAFKTEIFNRYGPHEMEGVAYACHEHQGMHMAIDSVHTEFLDDANRPVGPGENARIVLTDLDSRLMPLIRYEIGDMGSYLDEPCACGRGLPLMKEIACRTRDVFETRNGEKVVPSRLVAVLQEDPSIRIFQLVQGADRGIEVRIVPNPTVWRPDSEYQIKAKLSAILSESEENIRLIRVETVGLESNGKFCYAKRVVERNEPMEGKTPCASP
jgi:phenylacetate-CoA ligase